MKTQHEAVLELFTRNGDAELRDGKLTYRSLAGDFWPATIVQRTGDTAIIDVTCPGGPLRLSGIRINGKAE